MTQLVLYNSYVREGSNVFLPSGRKIIQKVMEDVDDILKKCLQWDHRPLVLISTPFPASDSSRAAPSHSSLTTIET